MAQMATPALLDLARTHLSLPPSASAASVPSVYIDELRAHTNLYPYDTLFRVTLEPKKGFGSVTCLEDGCENIAIPLIRRVKTKDGGLSLGFGSLAPYRVHIEGHATHKRNRLARIKADTSPRLNIAPAAGPSRAVVKKESPSVLDALNSTSPFGTPHRQSFGSPRLPIPASSSPAAPSAPSKTLIPKRSSLVRVTPRANVKPEPVESTIPRKRANGTAFKAEDTAPLKKVKQEDKVPLALVNRNMMAKSEPVAAPIPAVDVEEVRRNISFTQAQISHLEDMHDRIQRKKNKTKAQITRMSHHASELQRLRKLKAQYDASLPRAASPIKRTGSKSQLGKTESLPRLPPAFYNPAVAKPKTEPFNMPFPQFPYDIKPVVQHNAVASSSRGSGARALPDISSDDEMEVDPVVTLNKYLHAIPDIAPLGGIDHADANGDYHGRGRDTFVGPQAKADDIDKFLIEAGNAQLFDGDESIDKALEKLGLQSTHELLPSLDIPLMPHQLIGVAWMVENEKKKSLKCGCLADEMGLGKTVQMIACMCKNPSEDPACKTTLIIAPLALLGQWNQEISTKTNAGWKVLIYHGSGKPKKKADLLQYDVVLTTYATMAGEWFDLEGEEKRKKKKQKAKKPADDFIASDSDDSGSDQPKTKTKRKRDHGLLYQVDFFRIVLDEAQNIRNKTTRASRAVTDLRSIYRWCLTATPIVNRLSDVYGYLRFLRVRPWYDWTEFNTHVGRLEKKQPQLAVTRLQAILGLFMMRRMKTSELNGKRLIELPEKTVELVSLEFSKEERDIYSQVEKMQQAKFNRYLRAGTVLKNYASVLVMLLRLRQLCSHPALIQENGTYFLAPDEVDEPEEYRDELARAREIMPVDFVKNMKAKFKEATLRRMEAEQESQDATAEVDDCPICFDVLAGAVVTKCAHQFCKDCLNEVFETPLPDQAGNANAYICKDDERPCPACRTPISADQVFPSAAFQPSDKDLTDATGGDSDIEMLDSKPAKAASKGKGKAKAKRPARKNSAKKYIVLDSSDVEAEEESASEDDDKDSDMSDFIVESDEDEDEKDARLVMKKRLGKRRAITTIIDSDDELVDDTPEEKEVLFGAPKKKLTKEEVKLLPRFLPSTKMKEMMDVLKKLMEEHPDEKTLVISQWTGCLTIVSDYLTEAGIVHVKYQGDMSSTKREAAIQVFMSKDKARVMLMSAKCGGVGLNLTRANNVISLDLGWSPAMDQQAFDRVHRLGQHRDVIVKRLVIANTVEDRILALQERKKNLADGSLGEGSGKKIGRLSVRELANLFGLDARGHVLAKD
ncbi:SNF2 superfamily protein [Mycena alexandri]|uniref:SNF2 superfamily protein n=1 Tax=Mycena alexandri TaxID=1745969 RepID=A0AAD6X9H4_9AGAR|nr:SNF2 superfamily protein [Mycena alexandri]